MANKVCEINFLLCVIVLNLNAQDVPIADSFSKPIKSEFTIGLDWGEINKAYKMADGEDGKHVAIDLVAPAGTDVEAVCSGIVRFAREWHKCPNWGFLIIIESRTPDEKNFSTLYGHIKPSVNEGEVVEKGRIIGTIAHFECWKDHLHIGMCQATSSVGVYPEWAVGYLSPKVWPGNYIDPEEQIFKAGVPDEKQIIKGILRFPIDEGGVLVGETGEVVSFASSDSSNEPITVQLADGTYHNIWNAFLVPYDPRFTVSWAYLQLSTGAYAEGLETKMKEANARYRFAQNILKLFPSHPLEEEIMALIYNLAVDCESGQDEEHVSHDKSITAAKEYLSKFPNGKYKDRFELELLEQQNYRYEFEGSVKDIVEQANMYEEFLAQHPRYNNACGLKTWMARLYRMAYESFVFSKAEQSSAEQDGQLYLQKARKLLQELLECEDTKIREKARVDLYNIDHNKRTYVDPDEWK
jgi:hypothetical protein